MNIKQFRHSICYLALTCSSLSKDEESTTTTADTSAPIVTAVSPIDGNADVSVKSKISITFSKSIEPANVTVSTTEYSSGSMQLFIDDFYTCFPAVSSYDSSRKIYTMTPGSSTAVQELDSLLKHKVKVTTSVKDYFSIAHASDYSSAGFASASVCSSTCFWN